MNSRIYQTDLTGLAAFYEAVIGDHLTYAPVEVAGRYRYEEVTTLAGCLPDPPIAQTASIKPLFFPKASPVMAYRMQAGETVVDPPGEDLLARQRVILGVKHCDARALQVLDKIYSWDYRDMDYLRRRENTVLISPRCTEAGTHCFCTSLDYDPEHLDALDVAVITGGTGTVYLESRTPKGEKLVQGYAGILAGAGAEASAEMHQQYERFAASFRLKMDFREVASRMSERFDSPLFDEVSATCVSCNTCGFVCPTCHCFKISDETAGDRGIRYKSYDSCNNPLFTRMAGGHNPRAVPWRRWRQRAMHKFVYYRERFEENLCIGCGKCAMACPVKISIFDVVTRIGGEA